MARIAVCLSGHPRTFKLTAKKIKQALGEADFYFSTWSSDYNETLLSIFKEHEFNLQGYEFISEPLQLENERQILADFTNSFPDFFILNQWFGVKRSIQLMNDYSQALSKNYDIVVRCRFDLDCNFSTLELLDKFKPDSFNYVKATTGGSDQFLYGSQETMNHFLGFERWLLDFSKKFDPRNGFFASPLVRAYFMDKQIPVNRVSLNLKVHRADRTPPGVAREQRTRDYISKYFPEFEGEAWHGPRLINHVVRPGPWDKSFANNNLLMFVDGKLLI